MIKMGVQGILGCFSELAAKKFLHKRSIDAYQMEYLIDSKSVLKAIEQHHCQYGTFAVENSTGGVVMETIEALTQHCCQIEELFHIAIQQNLLTLPAIEDTDIEVIYSHPQAFLQCQNYLKKRFPQIPLQNARDTALAAEELHRGLIAPSTAIIGSKSCADHYNLKVLHAEINDEKDNQTLFIVATTNRQEVR